MIELKNMWRWQPILAASASIFETLRRRSKSGIISPGGDNVIPSNSSESGIHK